MKKTLPAQDIANELSASSVFFQSKEASKQTKPSTVPAKDDFSTNQEGVPANGEVKPRHHDTTASSHHEPVTPRNRAAKQPNDQPDMAQTRQATTPSSGRADEMPDMLEEVRRVVKQLGKEAATHRFTGEEKRAIADLVYTYHRQGYRTSENEITRIAVNWLLLDFKERGEQSVLARMLDLLHG